MNPDTPEGEFEESDDEIMLDLNRKDTKVWLVKIPEFVAKEWKNQPENSCLGQVRIYNNQNTKVTLHLPDASWSQSIPKNFQLSFTQLTPKNEFVFTENHKGKAVDIAGTVDHEATVTPIMDQDYERVMQERSKQAATVTRVSKVMDSKDEKRTRIGSAANDNFLRRKVTGERRERLPKADVLDMLFPAFQSIERYSIKALTDLTHQPQAWLKEILSEVAILHKRGPYTGLYELKPEYKEK